MNTTLNQLNSFQPSQIDFDALLAYLGKTAPDDAVLPITTCIDAIGIQDAVWCLKGVLPNDVTNKRKVELFALYCLNMLTPYFTNGDSTSTAAINTFIRGTKTAANTATLLAAYNTAYASAKAKADANPSTELALDKANTSNCIAGMMAALIDKEGIGYTSGEIAAAQANITALILPDTAAAWELIRIELVRVCNGGVQ